jgi:fructose-1-phosphate kinase PfkB-like protein
VSVLITDMTDGRQSTVIAPTLHAGPEHVDQLLAQVFYHASQSWGLVCAGSLPPGLPTDAWASLIKAGRDLRLVTLLDSSGDGLRRGVAGLPHILKINGRELADLARDDTEALPAWSAPDKLADLAVALQARLGRWASDAIAITLGSQGALLVTGDAAYFAPIVKVPVVSPAGAGDAVAAGIMLARRRGQSWAEALALGVATAAAVVMNEGTADCSAEQVHTLLPQVEIRDLFAAVA